MRSGPGSPCRGQERARLSPPFTGEEAEARRGQVACPRLNTWVVAEGFRLLEACSTAGHTVISPPSLEPSSLCSANQVGPQKAMPLSVLGGGSVGPSHQQPRARAHLPGRGCTFGLTSALGRPRQWTVLSCCTPRMSTPGEHSRLGWGSEVSRTREGGGSVVGICLRTLCCVLGRPCTWKRVGLRLPPRYPPWPWGSGLPPQR